MFGVNGNVHSSRYPSQAQTSGNKIRGRGSVFNNVDRHFPQGAVVGLNWCILLKVTLWCLSTEDLQNCPENKQRAGFRSLLDELLLSLRRWQSVLGGMFSKRKPLQGHRLVGCIQCA